MQLDAIGIMQLDDFVSVLWTELNGAGLRFIKSEEEMLL